jgi:hypothetical protein
LSQILEAGMHCRSLVAALCLLPAWPAAAQDLPARKAGLWEIRMTVDAAKMPPQISQHCIDAATDKQMSAVGAGMGKDLCSKQNVQRSGNTVTVDSVCKIGPTTSVTRAVITGDFNSAYTVRVTSKSDGGAKGAAGDTAITIEAKWLGACKPDQRPGDIIMADGRKMNIQDLQKLIGGQGPPGVPPPRK